MLPVLFNPGVALLPKWLHACAVSTSPSTRLTWIRRLYRSSSTAEKDSCDGQQGSGQIYYSHSGFPGRYQVRSNFSKSSFVRAPERIIESAVKGMLPKNPLGRAMYRKMKVTKGAVHPAAQQPQELKRLRSILCRRHKTTVLAVVKTCHRSGFLRPANGNIQIKQNRTIRKLSFGRETARMVVRQGRWN